MPKDYKTGNGLLTVILIFSILAAFLSPDKAADAADNSWSMESIPSTTGKLLAPGSDVSDLAVASDNTTVYVTDRQDDKIYRSTDTGVTWSAISKPGGVTEPQLIAIAPDNVNLIAIIADGNEVYYSTDGGESWSDNGTVQEPGEAPAAALYDIAISDSVAGMHYIAAVGTEAGPLANIWYYDMGAASPQWRETNDLAGFGSTTSDVAAALSFSPNFSSDQVMVAVTEEDDGGAGMDYIRFEMFSFVTLKWNGDAGFTNYPVIVTSDDGITGIDAASIALAPDYNGNDSGTRVALIGLDIAGDSGTNIKNGIYGLYDSMNRQLEQYDKVKSIVYNGSDVAAGIADDNDVLRSDDLQKKGIFPPSVPVPGGEKVVLAFAGDSVLAGTSGNNSTVSRAATASSDFSGAGLVYPGEDISDLAVSAYGTVGYATDTQSGKLYKSTDNGTNWTELNNPAGAAVPQLIAISWDNASVAALAADNNEVYLSTSGGDNWTDLGLPTGNVTITDIDVSPRASGDIYYVAVSGNDGSTGKIWYYEYNGAEVWVDASVIDGFNTTTTSGHGTATDCLAVTFSPNFANDFTVMAVTLNTEQTSLEIFHVLPEHGDIGWNRAIDSIYFDYPLAIRNNGTNIIDASGASIALGPDFIGIEVETLISFVGVRTDTSDSGGLHRIDESSHDEVMLTGVNINSVIYDVNYLIAGEYDTGNVWRTEDPLSMTKYWPHLDADFATARSLKWPSGENSVVVAWAGDILLAGASGDESSFSFSADNGLTFNDRSLIDTTLDHIQEFAVAADGSRLYLATDDGTDTSLWRKYGGTWQRVLSVPDSTGYIVRIAPADPDVVYLAREDDNEMYYSDNGGITRWSKKTTCPCEAQDMTVESETIAYVLGVDGGVTKTSNKGSGWSTITGNMIFPIHIYGLSVMRPQRITTAPVEGIAAFINDDTDVYISMDTGINWYWLGETPDAAYLNDICLSSGVGSSYNIYYMTAVGVDTSAMANVWYFNLGATVGSWRKATITGRQAGTTRALAVVASPNFVTDRTLAAVTTNGTDTYLELFRLDESPAWNAAAGYAGYPVRILAGGASVAADAASIALPPTFLGTDNATLNIFIGIRTVAPGNGGIFNVNDTAVTTIKSGVDINRLIFHGESLLAGEYATNKVWRCADPSADTPQFATANVTPSGESKVVLASAGGIVFAGTSGNASAFSVSTDGGASFATRSYTEAGTDVSDFAFDSDNTTILLVDLESDRLKKSTDGGVYWFRDYSANYGHSLTLDGSGQLVMGSVNGYVTYSTDGAATWTDIHPQIEVGALQTRGDASGLSNGDFIYAASSKTDSKIVRWQLGYSTSWEDMAAPVPSGYGVYSLTYYNGALYALASDNTSNSVLLRSLYPTDNNIAWSNLGSVSDTLNHESGLQISSGSNKLWAIGTTGNALYSLTDTTASPPSPTAPTGGGGGGGGGSSGVTSFSGIVTDSGKFVQEITAGSVDGRVSVAIMKDTIGLNKYGQPLSWMSIKPMANPPAPYGDASIIGLAYELGPDGANFSPPATLTFTYNPSLIPAGVSEGNLRLASWDNDLGEWGTIECFVDPEADTTAAQLAHFSAYAIIAATAPAEITTSDLTITPIEIDPGEEVTVSVLATNTGDIAGSREVALLVDDTRIHVSVIELAGHASRTIVFTVNEPVAGTYRVAVDDQSNSFMVRAPAAFVVSGVSVQPTECSPGETVTVIVTVKNTGEIEGMYTPLIEISGEKEKQAEITVYPDETTQIVFALTKNTPGTYTIRAGELTANFSVAVRTTSSQLEFPVATVRPPALSQTTLVQIAKGTNWLLTGIIGGCILMVGVLVIALRRRN